MSVRQAREMYEDAPEYWLVPYDCRREELSRISAAAGANDLAFIKTASGRKRWDRLSLRML